MIKSSVWPCNSIRRHGLASALSLATGLIWINLASGQIVQRWTLLGDGWAAPRAHNMSLRRSRQEGVDGPVLWLNEDWSAKPWAVVHFRRPENQSLRLTEAWLQRGFIHLRINVTVDRYGNIGGSDRFQLLLQTEPPLPRYQELRSTHIDRGRGIDEIPATWQPTYVPLSYFGDLKPGHVINGLSFQTRRQTERTFGLAEIELVKFERVPPELQPQREADIRQAWVDWPQVEELPEAVRADRDPVQVRDGAFVKSNGRRAFLLSPYLREDSRSNYAVGRDGARPSTYGLYDRAKHTWIYDQIPDTENLVRLGFNSFSSAIDPDHWWRRTGLIDRRKSAKQSFLSEELAPGLNLPFHVDCVAWPYTVGKPGLQIEQTQLPAGAATVGRNHWTPYRTIGEGRRTWLDLWRSTAQRYRDAGVSVATFELMNEPAYVGQSRDHVEQFRRWLTDRYNQIDDANATWRTDFSSFAEAAETAVADDREAPLGWRLDYDEYLAARFTSLVADGARAVQEVLPETLVGVQTMSGYVASPRESVWKHRFVEHETVVLTPTGGGTWTAGGGVSERAETLVAHAIASSPIENDLLLALADDRMILDNETYLRGQTRSDTRHRLWEHVICGLDGLTVFSWSKRGWVWWDGIESVRTDADKYPYSTLIPLARRTDALRGILDFSIEVQSLAPEILAKPWGPEPRIGLVYSWDDARRKAASRDPIDRLQNYHAALRYGHWNMAVLPADRLIQGGVPAGMRVLIAGGIEHVERQLPTLLERFVRGGGALIVGHCGLDRDIYGRLLQESSLGVQAIHQAGEPVSIVLPGSVGKVTPLQNRTLADVEHWTPIVSDQLRQPVLMKRSLGRGQLYYLASDVAGYALEALLGEAMRDIALRQPLTDWQAVDLRDPDGRHAANVLVSRRSYDTHHALLLHNRDRYSRRVRLRMPGLHGAWRVQNALTTDAPVEVMTAGEIAEKGLVVSLAPEGPGVVLLYPGPR